VEGGQRRRRRRRRGKREKKEVEVVKILRKAPEMTVVVVGLRHRALLQGLRP
jgi:hypothetical protein